MMKAVADGTRDTLNFYKYPEDMPVAGKYDIPMLRPIKIKHPEKYQLIAFDEAHLIPEKDRKKYIVHFFIYDYKFERVFTYLKKNTEYLRQFAAVIAPDFSQYIDMPRAMQIWNAWRCNFVAWWWQNEGLHVIPDAHWSDEYSYEYCFDGVPQGGAIAVSSKGIYVEDKRLHKQQNQDTDEYAATQSRFKAGLFAMIEHVHPSQIIWIGSQPVWLQDILNKNNIELIIIKPKKLYAERMGEIRG